MIKRILSAIFLLLVFVPILIAGGRPFSVAVGVLSLLGLKEILDLRKSHSDIPSGIILFSMCMLLFLIFYEFELHPSGISFTVLAILSIGLLFPTLLEYKKKNYETKDAFYLFAILCFLGAAFHSVIEYRTRSLFLLLYLVLTPILTDTFAYFVGKYFGKRKIAPSISPNKTVAGSLWGSILGTLLSSCFYYFMIEKTEFYFIVFITFLLSVVGQFGDLFFSKIKRENGVKDFSNLIPGHGGVLDRFDSLIFVLLAFKILERFI